MLLLIGDWVVPLIDNNPEVVDVARRYLAIVPISYGLWGVLMMASAAFNSLGKPIPSTIMAFTRMFVVYVPLAMIADHLFGYTGIFVATAMANCVMGAGAMCGSNARCRVQSLAVSPLPDSRQREQAWRRHGRRAVTVPPYLLLTAIATALIPLPWPLCWLVSLRRASRGALRSVAFVTCYLWCESIGIVVSAWLWVRWGLPTRNAPNASNRWQRFLDANFALQCWWANALKMAAERLFRLRFIVEGTDALDGPPAIVLPRHASIADTIIPMVFYAIPTRPAALCVEARTAARSVSGYRRQPLAELLRCAQRHRRTADLDRVTALADDLQPDEGFLIYPEGTRFSVQRQQRVLTSLADRVTPTDLERMRGWTELLPPRPGGTLALIAAAPNLDLVFCAHTGFEGASHVRQLINGSWIAADIRIRFWRIQRHDMPLDEAALRAFLIAQWDRMQDTVVALKNG